MNINFLFPKRYQLLVLPTHDESPIGLHGDKVVLAKNSGFETFSNLECFKHNPVHLYIRDITDDYQRNFNDGDWIFFKNNSESEGEIMQIIEGRKPKSIVIYKIIASTNPKLKNIPIITNYENIINNNYHSKGRLSLVKLKLSDDNKFAEIEYKYPLGGYFPGNYSGKCRTCNESFAGDKRAYQCEKCAVEKFINGEDKEDKKVLSISQAATEYAVEYGLSNKAMSMSKAFEAGAYSDSAREHWFNEFKKQNSIVVK
jgi:hypothetical protein